MTSKDGWFIGGIENTIGRIPIVGTFIAAVILMIGGVLLSIFYTAFIGLILIPYRLIQGIIDPDRALGKPPFDSPRDYFYMSRTGFVVIFIFGYVIPFGGIIFILVSKWIS